MLSIGYIFSNPLHDHVSSKVIVIITTLVTIPKEEDLILTLTKKNKSLLIFHGILDYTHDSRDIPTILEGKYMAYLFC